MSVQSHTITPDIWTEATPAGVADEGQIGGDIQAGPAHSRRFIRYMSDRELWAVITDSFYLAKCDHDGDYPVTGYDGETLCRRCGPLAWVEEQCVLIICRDPDDPGGTEVDSDYSHDTDICAHDSEATDQFARQRAQSLRADMYGDPWI